MNSCLLSHIDYIAFCSTIQRDYSFNNELYDNLKYMYLAKLQPIFVKCKGHFTWPAAAQDTEKIMNLNSAMLHSCSEQEAKKNALVIDTGLWGVLSRKDVIAYTGP